MDRRELGKVMEKHPLFMKDSSTDEMPPLVGAMKQLKYNSECNTKMELAMTYKEDGNYNFKNRKHKWAIDSYSEGIKQM